MIKIFSKANPNPVFAGELSFPKGPTAQSLVIFEEGKECWDIEGLLTSSPTY